MSKTVLIVEDDKQLLDSYKELVENAGFTFDEILGIFSELDDPMLNTLDLNDVRDATFMFS